VLMLETEESAHARSAKIWGEVAGQASSTVVDKHGAADYRTAFANVIRMALKSAEMTPDQIGHINAHGLGTTRCDRDEAAAIIDVFGSIRVPVVAMKSYHGHLGAGSGMVEAIGSLLALENGRLFRTLNYQTPDPECPIAVVGAEGTAAGDSFINLSVTPQGQAAAVIIRKYR
jgi:3-oxoacyl-[acyl-carrier-protein] synthase II